VTLPLRRKSPEGGENAVARRKGAAPPVPAEKKKNGGWKGGRGSPRRRRNARWGTAVLIFVKGETRRLARLEKGRGKSDRETNPTFSWD